MGKIFACSDLHGRYDKYERIMEHVTDDDTLYFLGDAIDRNPDGMKILIDVMTRKNVEFFIGNHELMMYCTLFMHDELSAVEKDRLAADGTIFSDSPHLNGLTIDRHSYGAWTNFSNRGDVTLGDFLHHYIDRKDELRQFFLHAHVRKTITIGGKKYCLSHTGYTADGNDDLDFADTGANNLAGNAFWHSPFALVSDIAGRKIKDMGDRTVLYPYDVAAAANADDFDDAGYSFLKNAKEDVTYICGHIFVQRLGTDKMACMVLQGRIDGKEKHVLFADIDGGCAMNENFCKKNGIRVPRAVLYNITDDEAVYV